MNYIERINSFWLANEEHSFCTTDIALYFYLLKVNNSCSWKESFKRNNSKIQSDLGISFNTLKNARNRLKQSNIIDFKTSNGCPNVLYSLNSSSKNDKVTNEVTTEVGDEVTTEVLPTKDKLNKTKLKVSSKPPSGDLPSKPKSDFIDDLVKAFADKYSRVRGVDYAITNKGKERAAASKLLKLYKDKYPEANTSDTLESLSKYFEACVSQITDNWLHQNMSLPMIINKFNELNNILRNGNKRTTGRTAPQTSDAELAGVFAKHFATDYPGK